MAHSQQQQQRYLKELLQEDQEPFQLSSYIADKRSKLSNHIWKRPRRQKHPQQQQPPPSLQLEKQPPRKSRNAPFSANFCKNAACFPFSHSSSSSPFNSPRKSPILLSPRNIKGSSSNSSPSDASFPLRVPAKTATLLLEAALRIHNSSSSSSSNKPKGSVKSSGFGLLGSVLRRVTLTNHRRSTQKHLLQTRESETGEDDVVKWADDSVKFDGGRKSKKSFRRDHVSTAAETRGEYDMGCGGNCEEDRTDGSLGRFWSEEIKSEESSGSSSSSSSCCTSSYSNIRDQSDDEDEETACFCSSGRDNNGIIDDGSVTDDFSFCSSPFRFGRLYNSPSASPSRRLSSPAKSPCRFKLEERSKFEQQQQDSSSSVESSSHQGTGEHDDQEEEEREQNSPVCVLDLAFGDDEEEEYSRKDNAEAFNLNCSYELVQRARQHLLRKLQKFEELAGLEGEPDPEVEPIRKLDYEEVDEYESLDDEEEGDDSTLATIKSNKSEEVMKAAGMKRLISDLISEEEEEEQTDNDGEDDYEMVIRRVRKRLESWEEIEPSTIEMMAGFELSREVKKSWVHGKEEMLGASSEVELLILSVLVEEVVDDLLSN